MFAPRKRKLGDLDIEEVISTIVPMIGGDPGHRAASATEKYTQFAPVQPESEAIPMGYGRTMDADAPAGQPMQTAPVPTMGQPASVQPTPTFAPRTRQDSLNAEYDRNDQLRATGAPKEHSVGMRLLQGALRGLATGGIGGAITGAAVEGFYPKANTQMRTKEALAKSNAAIPQMQKTVDFENDQLYKKAQREDLQRRPIKEANERQGKLDLEAQKQLNRLGTKAEERRLKGLSTKFDTAKDGSGRVVIVDGNGNEELVTTADGAFEYNLLEKPEATQIEDGSNPDGTKKYRTVYAKGSQVLSNDSANKYRQGMLALGKERIDETKRSNRVREGLAQKQFEEAKSWRQQQLSMRQEIEDQKRQAQANGDTVKAQQLANDQIKLDTFLREREAFWKTNIGKGGFTKEDFDELMDVQ